ncbi:hypothetical protein PV328_006146 [Microctonus aethiopoides]|uniref:Proton-associated sugar transporter A n=2 Tax=Microctonus TaxID=144405 RepID=A0AA39FP03_9HYME|nr:hypothetical protein PV328_006146 [Microctonus aethiopoides]
MVDKLHDYEGITGRLHGFRDKISEKFSNLREWKNEIPSDQGVSGVFNYLRGPPKLERTLDDYSHIYREKTRGELVRTSAAVMGIEFSYAAETAFVSPTLLKIGVDHQHMTLVWALSPLVGFFVTPILGSLSDRCGSKFGRRRPFIMILAFGVFLGLLLVPNGERMGYAFGDPRPLPNHTAPLGHRVTAKELNNSLPENPTSHSWGIFFTILGTVLLDFDADACQSPARAYLLDVTIPEDHARGLSTFTIMAGLGGFMGYGLGGINWDATSIGVALGGHVQVTFTIISTRERNENENDKITDECTSYGAVDTISENTTQKNEEFMMKPLPVERTKRAGSVPMIPDVPTSDGYVNYGFEENTVVDAKISLTEYLLSILYMPYSVRMVCLTNLFCWMAHVCYSLYFTDFVGEAVYGGNPQAPDGTKERELYESGVRFGCWGMSMYSLSCACYSLVIEKLIQRYKARKVYVCGLLFYSTGMLLMALTKHPVGVIIFSWTAGVMYSTLFTMPYLLIAHYHASSTFAVTAEGNAIESGGVRGLGTDVAIVSSMVFLAQFILSCGLGTIVSLSGTTTAVVCVASTLAACGAISATQIMYLDL